MATYQSGSSIIKCPFCGEHVISAFHKPSFAQASRTSISAGVKYTYHRKDEVYEIAGDCPKCGAKEKDIYKKVNGLDEDRKVTKEDHQKLLERLKSMGMPTKIERRRDG